MMLIKKAFRCRIYPNQEQQRRLTVQFGHARLVYNWGLTLRKTHYRQKGQGLSYFVGRFFPSSKLCSKCGEVHPSMKLSERQWVCAGCGTIHNRDRNAAQNILVEG
jgi:putative transposase